jgi:hypothetical protein
MSSPFLRAQVSAYCVSALVGGAVFLRWWSMSVANKSRIWSLYGWFCGLTTFGSFVGIFTWIARMQQLVNNLEASELLSQTVQSRTYMGNDLYSSPPLVTAPFVYIYNRSCAGFFHCPRVGKRHLGYHTL